ncbi:MAG: DUF5050 domain-containing protein [Oscillospiraceae bacterium]|nr:DUF5050 domain-containing protein [Oscillospiraceae bacterium]
MNEEKYFELTGGLRPDFIAEAAEWKHEDHSAESEIGAIFEADLKRRTQELHSDADTEKELPSAEAPEVEPIEPMPEIRQNDMPRHLAAGITAIAAAIALTIGAFVYKAQRTGDSVFTPAGTTLADSSILSVQTGMEPGIAEQTQTAAQSGSSAAEDPASVTDSTRPGASNNAESISGGKSDAEHYSGTNFLGGTGHLRMIASAEPVLHFEQAVIQFDPNTLIGTMALEDDVNWYLLFGGQYSRISKTERDADGKAHNEYICQQAGCSHNREDCPAFLADQLVTDGRDLYAFSQNTLFRISDDGTKTPFFLLNEDPDGNRYYNGRPLDDFALDTPAENFYSEMTLVYFTRLGDTGKWFAEFQLSHFDNTRPTLVNVFFEPMNEKGESAVTFIKLPYRTDCRFAFDREKELLYAGVPEEHNENEGFSGYLLYAIDIHTGEARKQSDAYLPEGWFYFDGKVYGISYDTQEIILNRLVNGGHAVPTYGCLDPETGEWTVIEEKTNLGNIFCIGNKVYARRQRSVGDDTVIRMNPDGTDEEVLYTRKNRITALNYVSEGFIFLQTSGGFELILNGECIPLDFRYDF